jgi:hypothetical protein
MLANLRTTHVMLHETAERLQVRPTETAALSSCTATADASLESYTSSRQYRKHTFVVIRPDRRDAAVQSLE